MAGRRPKPTKLKIIEGNLGRRPLNDAEPEPSTEGVRMPAELSAGAKAEWERIAPELQAIGILSVADLALFRIYCESVAEFDEAQAFIRDNGRTYVLRDKDGAVRFVQQFPQVAIARNAAERVRKIAIEFGMSPASRSKVKAAPKPKKPSAADRFRDKGRNQ